MANPCPATEVRAGHTPHVYMHAWSGSPIHHAHCQSTVGLGPASIACATQPHTLVGRRQVIATH